MVRRGSHGKLRSGTVLLGGVRHGSLGELCLGSARRGLEWHRQGRAVKLWRVQFCYDKSRTGMAVQAVLVLACRGLAGKGRAWYGSRGETRIGVYWLGQSGKGKEGLVWDRLGWVRFVEVRQSRLCSFRPGPLRTGLLWLGWAVVVCLGSVW